MKKLLSICFLSILLGLLSFSTQAQSNNCRSGFWIENLQPETLTGIANAPSGNGTLVLDNVLNPAVKGQTDLYELHFCPCGLDPKTKVSVDWLLYRDGQLVNENLSAYADFSIYTLYPELNVQGQCQQIAWLGGQVANNFGFCNEQEAANNALIALQNNINGVGPCTTPTNYPGALQSQYGTQPGSVVVNQITGETTSAMGLATLYSQAFDFFYMDFFTQTRTIVKITWKQVGNYSLVMRVRERVGGTDWNNAYWKRMLTALSLRLTTSVVINLAAAPSSLRILSTILSLANSSRKFAKTNLISSVPSKIVATKKSSIIGSRPLLPIPLSCLATMIP